MKPVVIVPSAQTKAALAEDTELLSLNEKLDGASASSDCTHNPAFLFIEYASLVKVTFLGFQVVLLHQGVGLRVVTLELQSYSWNHRPLVTCDYLCAHLSIH